MAPDFLPLFLSISISDTPRCMHGYTHTWTHRQTPSLSHTWPTSQIRAPFILQYIELLCDSPRQRAAILLKAVVNHLWQRETAKDEDLHIHTSLVWTVGRVEFLCLTRQWWINFFPLRVVPPVSLTHETDTFSLLEIHVVSLFLSLAPVPLSLCTFLSDTHKHTEKCTPTHTQNFPGIQHVLLS